jgi:hypothetical protein
VKPFDWHVPPEGDEDGGQHVPEDVSCESTQDAAWPPPGSWQVSSPVGVEPGAQQASPSDVNGPGQVGEATEGSTPPQTKIVMAATKVTAATRRPSRRTAIRRFTPPFPFRIICLCGKN